MINKFNNINNKSIYNTKSNTNSNNDIRSKPITVFLK